MIGLATILTLTGSSAVCAGKQGVDRGQEESSEIKMTNPAVKSGLELHVSGRKIVIAPGEIEINGSPVRIQKPTMVVVPPPGMLQINEQKITVEAPKDPAKPTKFVLRSCMATDKDITILRKVLVPGTLKLKPNKGEHSNVFKEGIDYTLDVITGYVTVTPESAIKVGETVYADYSCWRRRLDTIAVNQNGELLLVQGIPARSAPEPAKLDEGLIPLANVYSDWGEGPIKGIDITAVASTQPAPESMEVYKRNRAAMAPIMAKMRAGKPVKIAFWGDGVLLGMDARSRQSAFPYNLISRLRKIFPKSEISGANCSHPSNTSSVRIANFDTEVLALKPDLIVISFLSDLALPSNAIENNYQVLRDKVEKAGVRLLVVTPHFPTPKFARASSWQTIADKSYMTLLRDMQANHDYVALADVARRWERLRSEGLRPDILLLNELSFPNDKGHSIYTEEALKAFGINPVDNQPLPPPPPPKYEEPVFPDPISN